MTEGQKKLNNFLVFFTVFLISFFLGFYISNNIYSLEKIEDKIKDGSFSVNNLIKQKFVNKDLNLDLFWQVYNIITQNYYSSNELEQKKLEYGLIEGLVNSLGDKFSEFMQPEETKRFEEMLNGDFEGIGAVVDKNELGVVVDRVLKGSPAINAGILKGDIIIEADGKPLKDLTINEAVSLIKGPAGTKVILKILRSGENDFITKEIIRDRIKIPSVDIRDLGDEEIGYISLNLFGENTSQEFLDALNNFNSDKVKGIIIDLRDNGGGYLQSATEILSNFIKNGKLLVAVKYKDSLLNSYYYSTNSGKVVNKKIVVLINENSASASEITAGVLRDYNKAILVGKKSYGKGSVQQPFDLPDGSMLKLTIAKWYTPKDYSIDNNGLEPDIEISFKKEDYTPPLGKEKEFKFYDRQLEEAKKILKKFIKYGSINLAIEEYKKENLDLFGTGKLVGSGVLNE